MIASARRLVLLVLPVWLLGGCASAYLKRAPGSPSDPVIPDDPRQEASAGSTATSAEPPAAKPVEEAAVVQQGRRYVLPELIELAAASNPETRIVWQRARQAALAVGVANSSYWPTLQRDRLWRLPAQQLPGLVARLGPQSGGDGVSPRINFPAGQQTGTSGHVGVDTFQVLPFVALRWQALDLLEVRQ
jgi:hypothetical protein